MLDKWWVRLESKTQEKPTQLAPAERRELRIAERSALSSGAAPSQMALSKLHMCFLQERAPLTRDVDMGCHFSSEKRDRSHQGEIPS